MDEAACSECVSKCSIREVMEEEERNPKPVATQYLFLVPEEIWCAVLDNLKDPKDVRNCYYSNALWNRLLEPYQYTWQFGLTFPKLFRYLPKNDILKCRSVCKNWKGTVDAFLESDQFTFYNSTTNYWNRKVVELNFEDVREEDRYVVVDRFRREMENSTWNPIVSRSVTFPDDPNLRPFLRTFGRHLWSISLSLLNIPDGETRTDYANYLFDMMRLCPDLRSFQVLSFLTDRGDEDNPQEELEELHAMLNATTLPPLPELKALEIRLRDSFTRDRAAVAIYQKLLRTYGPQLEVLFHGHSIPYPGPMLNLKDLSVMVRNIDQVNSLTTISSPLEVLDLIIHIADVSPRKLFRTVEHFRGTLKILSLRFIRSQTFGKNLQFPQKVKLPFLEELKLEDMNARSDMSWNFLKCLTRLRRLEVRFNEYSLVDVEPRRREKVHFSQHLDEHGRATEFGLYFSNIWHILPNLHRITLWRISHRYRRVFSRPWWSYIQDEIARRIFAADEEDERREENREEKREENRDANEVQN